MIKGLMRLIKYLYPKRPFHKPRHAVISPYPAHELNQRDDLTYLVRLGIARSREHAHNLMKQYNVMTAEDLIRVLPHRRRPNRFYDLLMRIDGHDPRDLYRVKARQTVRTEYIFRDDNVR